MTPSPEDQLTALDMVAAALAQEDDRSAVYRAAEEALQCLVGHRLFTLLAVHPAGDEVQRFWSSNEADYPLTGRKRLGSTPWGDVVLRDRRPWLGRDRAAIMWAFADHELIERLGLGSAINIPVMIHGRLLGTINLLHSEGHFKEAHLQIAARIAPYLAPALAAEIRAIETGMPSAIPSGNPVTRPARAV